MTNAQHFEAMVKMASDMEAAMTPEQFDAWMQIPEQARKDAFFEMYWKAVSGKVAA